MGERMHPRSAIPRLRQLQSLLRPTSTTRAMSSSKSTSLARPADSLKEAKVLGREGLKEPKWVQLEGIKWVTPKGQEKLWEVASRKTRGKAGVDAVAILALISHPSKPLSTVIVLQFRPPVNNICVELPAGLVDADEEPEKAGERELYEETGYKGKTEHVSPVIVSDPGMTTANMCLTTVKVELDEGEFIEKRIVAVKDLYQTLLDYNEMGYTVDARLMHVAWGLELSQKYTLWWLPLPPRAA